MCADFEKSIVEGWKQKLDEHELEAEVTAAIRSCMTVWMLHACWMLFVKAIWGMPLVTYSRIRTLFVERFEVIEESNARK